MVPRKKREAAAGDEDRGRHERVEHPFVKSFLPTQTVADL